ncbi:FecCD family ABC transporter permease [Candidatus Clostridium radicumherbarum]|uniref:FecCD family ABC transporter permease n=1 Tax=Candidatus Clostridium radicumherbarum TaxID=3381662 RepID=A0ABW8TNS4_9CLOT
MSYVYKRKAYAKIFILSIIVLTATAVGAVNFGAVDISFKDTARIIFNKIPFLNTLISTHGIKESSRIIVLNLRLPRIILATLVGMGLSVVGATYQSIFKNAMADSYVLGISSGAALGAALSIAFGATANALGMGLTTVSAFLGAILTAFFVLNIARLGSKLSDVTLMLAGVSMNFLLSSMISLIMIFKRNEIEKIVMWTMGSVSAGNWKSIYILAPIVFLGTAIICLFLKDLNMMMLGEESAQNLGVEVYKVKVILIAVSTIIVGAVVSFSGIIGFVGLIIPHIVRIALGSDNRVVVPFSASIGALFLILCDTLARSIVPPAEIPVGIVTSIFGVPFFLYLLMKNKKKVL